MRKLYRSKHQVARLTVWIIFALILCSVCARRNLSPHRVRDVNFTEQFLAPCQNCEPDEDDRFFYSSLPSKRVQIARQNRPMACERLAREILRLGIIIIYSTELRLTAQPYYSASSRQGHNVARNNGSIKQISSFYLQLEISGGSSPKFLIVKLAEALSGLWWFFTWID